MEILHDKPNYGPMSLAKLSLLMVLHLDIITISPMEYLLLFSLK